MKYSFCLLFVILFTACEKGDEFVYYDDPPFRENYSQVFNVLVQDRKVDILWVIDNSGSMYQIQSNIEKNTALFMQAFKENVDIEWKMGLVSTDKGQSPFIGFIPGRPFDQTSLDPVSEFQNAVSKLGTNGSASEYVFHNVDRMITKPSNQRSDDYSHFFREDAHLVVIMVSDEPEQSGSIDSKLYEPQAFLNHLRNFKAANRVIRFYGAFDFGDLSACSSWTKYKGSRFEKIIDESSGFHISACENSFGSSLAAIGKDIVSILKTPSLPINERPRVHTIQVTYQGEILPGGPQSTGGKWFYNRVNSTIDFYNLDFAQGELKEADIQVTFEIDDGVDREDEL